ncbi:hypothetical protein A2U01_0101018, partial [Trifolium medium]|nr:hypothetical protein [Trifolium medium]
MVVMLWM